jgi:membrane protease YdiL (CAAX protease family)
MSLARQRRERSPHRKLAPMTPRDLDPAEHVRERTAAWDVLYAALALAAVVIASDVVGDLLLRTVGVPPVVSVTVSYLVIWVPLLAAVVFAMIGLGRVGALRRLGLRLRPLDLVWGVGVGLVARVIDAVVNLGLVGATGLEPAPTIDGGPVLGVLVVTVLARVLLAPVVEEVFFRGLLQRSTARLLSTPTRLDPRGAAVMAVITTSLVFALMHALVGSLSPTGLLVTLVSTTVFGLLVGSLAAATGRIGGAVVAHVVFNGLAVWATWPA